MTHNLLPYHRDASAIGFTALGLVFKWGAVVCIFLLIIAVLLPSLGTHRPAYGARCASNLHQIGIALNTYAAENDGYFPTVPYAPYGPANAGTSPQGIAAINPADAARFLFDHKLQAGSPLASLWLLPLNGIVKDTRVFLCPMPALKLSRAPLADGPALHNFHINFSADDQIGYSLAYPWNPDGTVAATWRGANSRTSIIMTDIAPRSRAGLAAQPLGSAGAAPVITWVSANHPGKGMNALFNDAHVEFVRSGDKPPTPVPAVLMVPTRDTTTGKL
jgi:prepilin-type processing-associated H-X9-DG protein